MSATTFIPLVPGPVQGPTREEPQIEALLPDDYASLVQLAYLILPPSISRARRVAAAHNVVQRVLPRDGSHHREIVRRRVVQEAARQASRRTASCRLSSLFAPSDAADFNPCARDLDATTIRQRTTRGRRVSIIVTVLTAVGITASLLLMS
jgi:hypothetical protein